MMRSGNPTLNDKMFSQARGLAGSGEVMTLQGTVNKTLIMLVLLVISASYVWGKIVQPVQSYTGFETQAVSPEVSQAAMGFMMLGVFGSLIVALVTIFKKEWSPVTAPAYAILEGLALGGISAFAEMQYPGVVIQAVGLTFATLFCLLMAYKSGMIKATENFKLGIVAATGAIFVVYLISMILGFFGKSVPLIHGSGPVGIIFSLVVVTIAALNLVMDFDFIETASEQGVPKYFEWYGAFGLIVTLAWLYLEILRLLMKLQDRR